MTSNWSNKPPWERLAPVFTNAPGERSPAALLRVAAQFDVEHNPRYQPYSGKTFCNIYAWDVTSALCCEIPHWVGPDGLTPAPPRPGNRELLVNETVDKLHTGAWEWSRIPDTEHAVSLADLGYPVVATYKAERLMHGHIAIVLPGGLIAQAGRVCLFLRPLALGFGKHDVVFFGHK